MQIEISTFNLQTFDFLTIFVSENQRKKKCILDEI